ncbi:MAG: glycosyltransferase family 1 protein [Acidobacteriota bacterium]
MKILIDARPLQTYSRYRGIGRYVNQIIEIFKNDPDFYFLFFKGEDIDKRSKNRIFIKTPRRGVTFSDNIFLPRLLKKHRIDVFHSTAFALPPIQPGIKYIITIHDLTPLLFTQFSSAKNIYIFKKILKSAEKADKIIAVSKNTKNDLINLVSIPPTRISVVYNPVNLELDEVYSNKEKFKDIPPEYVFYAGGFDGNKNVQTLIKALNIFQKPLVLTGKIDSEQKRELNKILTDKSKNMIYYTGYISDQELTLLYKKARLFVFPSLYEGFGYPPLEALKNGTPSVVSGSGSMREVLKDAAVYLDDPLNEKELSKKIRLLWNDIPLREEIVNKGEVILKEYSIEKFKNNLKKIYSSVLSAPE